MSRFGSLRHPHLPWTQDAPATVSQGLTILALCFCGLVALAVFLNVLVGFGFDLLPGGGR
jgi:hypothetical protein